MLVNCHGQVLEYPADNTFSRILKCGRANAKLVLS